MKRMKLLCGIVSAVVVLGSVTAPKASAQILSNKWFKMKLSGKGYIIDATTKDATKGAVSIPAFAQFVSTATNATSVSYTIHLWTEIDGVWTNASDYADSTVSTNNETFFSDTQIIVKTSGGNSVTGYHSPHLNATTDKNGVFKKATYDGIGEILGGAIIDGDVTNNFIGSFSVKGSSVDPSKLPFTAP